MKKTDTQVLIDLENVIENIGMKLLFLAVLITNVLLYLCWQSKKKPLSLYVIKKFYISVFHYNYLKTFHFD